MPTSSFWLTPMAICSASSPEHWMVGPPADKALNHFDFDRGWDSTSSTYR